MARQSLEELVEVAYNAVPASGEIEYPVLLEQMTAAGNREAAQHLRGLKRAGRIHMEVRVTEDGTKHFVSRVGGNG